MYLWNNLLKIQIIRNVLVLIMHNNKSPKITEFS